MTAPAFTIERRRDGRSWAVRDAAGELVCVTLYNKVGAAEVARRLSALPAGMHAPNSGTPESTRPNGAKLEPARVCGQRQSQEKSGKTPEELRKNSGNTLDPSLGVGNRRAKGLPPGATHKARGGGTPATHAR